MAYATPVSGDDTIRRVITPIDEARGWMKLVAVLAIVAGVLVWVSRRKLSRRIKRINQEMVEASRDASVGRRMTLPIWMGVLLWQSAERSQTARRDGDEAAATESLAKLKTIFTIQGVVAIIALALQAFGILLFLTAGVEVGN